MAVRERWFRCKPLPDNILQRIEYLAPFFHDKRVKLVYLFGSLVRGRGNDVDIALLYEGDFTVMRDELQKRLGTWRLDIVNLQNAPIYIAFEVISTGRLIFKQDEETENSFEMNIVKRYQDLKPVRDKHLIYLKENLRIGF